MSRIGRLPVAIPAEVDVKLEGNVLRVKGPKGELTRALHPVMEIRMGDGQVVIARPSEAKEHKSLHGLTRTLVHNMVEGVTKGYEKGLELVGVGYRAAKQGDKLVITVGYSHPVEILPEEGLEIEVPAPNRIIVKGADKEKVGAMAARIRKVREPEPYKGKGIKYAQETVRRKVGKAGAGKSGKR